MKAPKASWLAAAGIGVLLGCLLWVGAAHRDRGRHYVVSEGQPTPDLPGSFSISVGNGVTLSVQAHLFTSALTIAAEIENQGTAELLLPRRAPRLFDANQVEVPFVSGGGCLKERRQETNALKPGETCLLQSRFRALGDERSLRRLRFSIDGVIDQQPVAMDLILKKWSK